MASSDLQARVLLKPASRGRPREFVVEHALEAAMAAFREKGYAATSIDDLAKATKLASGSIYKAFRDKRSLFLAALDHYVAVRNAQVEKVAGTEKSGLLRLTDVLSYYAASSRGSKGRLGCLVVSSATEIGVSDADVAARVKASFKMNETLIARLIDEGKRDGSIPEHVDARSTARVMVCINQGMRVMGRSGYMLAPVATTLKVALKLLA